MQPKYFRKLVLEWFDQFGRKDLPWQVNPTPYRVWISEIMLQQTQVTTVIPYYRRFMDQLPTIEVLSAASIDTVLHLWSGLGYYARARNLHRAAQIITNNGDFPNDIDQLVALPGIGRSTAGAIMSTAFQKRAPILDGNVKRVLCRLHSIEGWTGDPRVSRELWQLSERYTPQTRIADYTQAIMDIGATICTRSNPLCDRCPVRAGCKSFAENKVSLLPMPRPRKKIPVRKRFFLIVRNQNGEYYLENRPPTGIWGGLWSFPEFQHKRDMIAWCITQRIDHTSMTLLAERRHTFSHFHLDYQPVLVRQDYADNNVLEVNQKVWYNPEQKNYFGLPKPVSRLIDHINHTELIHDKTG